MQRNTIGRPMEILLVEDSLVAARITIGALRRGLNQHRLTWIDHGDEALDFLLKQGKYGSAPQPDLVLLDLTLPGADGRTILSAIRAEAELKQIPVVIVTGDPNPDQVRESFGNQVQAVVHKPLQLDAFLDLVEKLENHWKTDMVRPIRSDAADPE